MVRLLEKALVKESQIRELARDLLDLIAAGNHRVVLNFQAIERLASWMAFVVDEAGRRCAAGDGGALKVCGLPSSTGANVSDRRRRARRFDLRKRSRRDRKPVAGVPPGRGRFRLRS